MKKILLLFVFILVTKLSFSQLTRCIIFWDDYKPHYIKTECGCDSTLSLITKYKVDTVLDISSLNREVLENILYTTDSFTIHHTTYYEVRDSETYIAYWVSYINPSEIEKDWLNKWICKAECHTNRKIGGRWKK